MKKILSILLVICMLASVFSLTACGKKNNGNEDENKNENTENNGGNTEVKDNVYTVIVLDGANNPIAGVGIMISTDYKVLTTDENGKISFESDNAGVQIMVMSVPEGYEQPDKTAKSFAKGSKEMTVTVNAVVNNKVVYTITVVDKNGNPVGDVTVQLCTDALCYDTRTNADGIGTKELDPNTEYKVKVSAVPEGYVAPEGYFTTLSAGTTELIIELESAN